MSELAAADAKEIYAFLADVVKRRVDNQNVKLRIGWHEQQASIRLQEIKQERAKLYLVLELIELISSTGGSEPLGNSSAILQIRPDSYLQRSDRNFSAVRSLSVSRLRELERINVEDNLHSLTQMLRIDERTGLCFPQVSIEPKKPRYLTNERSRTALLELLAKARSSEARGEKSTSGAIPSLFESITGVSFETAKDEVWNTREETRSAKGIVEAFEAAGFASFVPELVADAIRHRLQNQREQYFSREVSVEPWAPDGLTLVAGISSVVLEPLIAFLKTRKLVPAGAATVSRRHIITKLRGSAFRDNEVVELLREASQLTVTDEARNALDKFVESWNVIRGKLNPNANEEFINEVESFISSIRGKLPNNADADAVLSEALAMPSNFQFPYGRRVRQSDINLMLGALARVQSPAGVFKSGAVTLEQLQKVRDRILQHHLPGSRVFSLLRLHTLTSQSERTFSHNLLQEALDQITYVKNGKRSLWNGQLSLVAEISERCNPDDPLKNEIVDVVSRHVDFVGSFAKFDQVQVSCIFRTVKDHPLANEITRKLTRYVLPGVTVPST